MAVEFANDTTKRAETLYSDWPENILVEPELNGRHINTDIESLAADIEAHGQEQPVGCSKNDDGQPVLRFGHRRYRSIVLLNKKNPEARRKIVFKYVKGTEAELFGITIRENRNRMDVSPIDDAVNIRILESRFGLTHEDIAAIYFPEAKTKEKLAEALRFVAQRAALQELAPEAAQAVRDGRVKLTAAVALAKLTKTQQRERVAGSGKIKGSDVRKQAPAPVKAAPKGNIKAALAVLFAECDQQSDAEGRVPMVFEIRCETIAAIRAAL